MYRSSEGRGLIARARAFAERQYDEETFKRAEKTAEGIVRAKGSYAQIATAYLHDAVRLKLASSEDIRAMFGEEVEKLTRE